jgi:hypothetical protein
VYSWTTLYLVAGRLYNFKVHRRLSAEKKTGLMSPVMVFKRCVCVCDLTPERIVNVVQQFMTEFSGAVSEEEKIGTITKLSQIS